MDKGGAKAERGYPGPRGVHASQMRLSLLHVHTYGDSVFNTTNEV